MVWLEKIFALQVPLAPSNCTVVFRAPSDADSADSECTGWSIHGDAGSQAPLQLVPDWVEVRP